MSMRFRWATEVKTPRAMNVTRNAETTARLDSGALITMLVRKATNSAGVCRAAAILSVPRQSSY